MSLPIKPKTEPRTEPVSIRLSKKANDALKGLAKAHNMSTGEVVEHLILAEVKASESKRNR